jgi:hypothetical protein
MDGQHLLDFGCGDVFPAANDQVFLAPRHGDRAVGIAHAQVAGAKEALFVDRGGGFLGIGIADHHRRPARQDFALGAIGQVVARFVHDAHGIIDDLPVGLRRAHRVVGPAKADQRHFGAAEHAERRAAGKGAARLVDHLGATAAPPQAKKRKLGSVSPASRAAAASSTRNGVAATVPATWCCGIRASAACACQLSISTVQVPTTSGISRPLA